MGLIDRDRLTCIGIVAQAHGVKGELKVIPQTDSPHFYKSAQTVILETSRGLRRFSVSDLITRPGSWIMALQEVNDREAAQALRGASILLEDASLKPLEQDEFFRHDLIGCVVETLDGKTLGLVEDVMETGANEVLVVSGETNSVMVPMVADVIKDVNIAGKVIRIDPIPGLLNDDRREES